MYIYICPCTSMLLCAHVARHAAAGAGHTVGTRGTAEKESEGGEREERDEGSAHTHTKAHNRARGESRTRTHMHAHARARTRAHTRARTCVCVCVRTCTCVRACCALTHTGIILSLAHSPTRRLSLFCRNKDTRVEIKRGRAGAQTRRAQKKARARERTPFTCTLTRPPAHPRPPARSVGVLTTEARHGMLRNEC